VAASPSGSVVTNTSGAISDAQGNVWTITSNGKVAVNGIPDTTTTNVVELAYVNGVVWYENVNGLWWYKTTPSDTWSPTGGTANSPLKTASLSDARALPPIGSTFLSVSDFDYRRTIISQYANAASLLTLIGAANQWLNPASNFANFYNTIWNLDTAQGVGLDIWGRIVGVTRVLQISTSSYFGFEEAQLGSESFNNAPFYTGQQTTNNYTLSDNSFRTLIIAKALSNICDGSIPAINLILLYLFPNRGNCYVSDNLNMTMTYTFDFLLTPVEVAIVQQSGVLPNPTGVSVTFVDSQT
jgi:hypothetical protein